MTDGLWQVAEMLLAFLLALQIASILSASCYLWCRSRLAAIGSPSRRAALILAFGFSAPFVALWSAVFLYLPDWAILVPPHCHVGDCQPHRPLIVHSLLASGVSALALLLVAIISLGLYLHMKRLQQRLSVLQRLSTAEAGEHYYLIDSPQPLAWCCGLWRPRVFISRGLQEHLSAAEIRVVLAHELAHALRRDNLHKLLLASALKLWPRQRCADVLADFELACEQACDDIAAEVSGRETVQNTLRHMLDLHAASTGIPADALRLTQRLAQSPARGTQGVLALLAAMLLWSLLQIPLLTSGCHLLLESLNLVALF